MNLSGDTKQEKEMCKLIHDTNTSLSRFDRCIVKLNDYLTQKDNKDTYVPFVLNEYFKIISKELKSSIDRYYLEFKKDFKK
jgi:hypothetical protein